MMRCATYARFSSDQQRATSIDDQFRNCEQYAARNGLTITARYKDEAISGGIADRPGYQALLKTTEAKQVDVILCDEISRLWRDQAEQWRTVKRLEFWGIHIIGVNDGIDTRRSGYQLLLAVRGAINEEARREIAHRTHRGLTGQVLKGMNGGGHTYGYRSVPVYDPGGATDQYGQPKIIGARREIVPAEEGIIKRIFREFASGASTR
ncbi:MAG: recombinase family protein, partial [Nitrospirota bacterium]